MRIIKRAFKKDSEGLVVLMPTDEEDLWHLYNLIQQGDCIRMRTFRKVTKTNSTGLKDVEKKKLVLTLCVVKVEPFAEGDYLTVSIRGRNVAENEDLKIGQYHTFVLQLNQKITIIKECWTGYDIGMLRELSEISSGCEVAAIVMDEGIANICYVKNSMTLRKLKIEKNVSKKSSGQEIHNKSLARFFQECYRGIKTVNYDNIKCMVVASPGFVNEQFLKYVKEASSNEADKNFKKELDKFILIKTSTGFIGSLNEALADPQVANYLKDSKAIKEVKALKKFETMIKSNFQRIAYGQKDVFIANKANAIETLLISDKLFRTKDLSKRKVYNRLVDEVRRKNGETFIFSSLHQSGQRLNNYSGVAAILRFEMQLDQAEEHIPEVQQEQKEQQPHLNENLLKRMNEQMGQDKSSDQDFQM